MVWSGVLLYLIYAYVIYAFDVRFNSLFLVYVAILGVSFYALVGHVIHLHLDQLQASFSANTKARAVSVFFLVLGLVFYLLWLSEEVSALMMGEIPPSVTMANLPTNPVHSLRFGTLLACHDHHSTVAVQKKAPGLSACRSFAALTGTAILAIFLVMSRKGMATGIGIEAFFANIIGVSLVLSVLYIREVKEKRIAFY